MAHGSQTPAEPGLVPGSLNTYSFGSRDYLVFCRARKHTKMGGIRLLGPLLAESTTSDPASDHQVFLGQVTQASSLSAAWKAGEKDTVSAFKGFDHLVRMIET